jgi:hypothetical protein
MNCKEGIAALVPTIISPLSSWTTSTPPTIFTGYYPVVARSSAPSSYPQNADFRIH